MRMTTAFVGVEAMPVTASSASADIMIDEVIIRPLPPAPKSLAGHNELKGKNFQVIVSNKAGYLCHLSLEGTWNVAPYDVFQLFSYPDNSILFRDIKSVGAREVLQTSPGLKVVKVEQLGELRVLWVRRTYTTWLTVTEDSRDPAHLITTFELLKSDVLERFSGRWDLYPVTDPATGAVTGTRGVLEQDVLPKGVPSFMAHMPLLGGLLRGTVCRTIERLMQDINTALDQVKAGHCKGETTASVLRRMCGSCAEQGFANAAVTSFAFDADDGSGNEGSDQEDTEAEVEHSGAKAGPHDKAAASSGTSSGGKESSSLTAEVAVEAHSVAGSASNKLLAPVGGSAVDGSQAAQQHVEQLESKEGAVVARAGQGTAGSQRDNPRLVHALLEVQPSGNSVCLALLATPTSVQ